MNKLYEKEFISITGGVPFKTYICNINSNPLHWHPELEILYLIDGELEVRIENQNYLLKKNDIILINSNQTHSYKKNNDENLAIVLQINTDNFKYIYPDINNIHFKCNSLIENDFEEKFDELRTNLLTLLSVYDKKEDGFVIELNIFLQQIILLLIRKFDKVQIEESMLEKSSESLRRLDRILNYIDENYDRKITLETLAKLEFLSTFYISRFFKENVGINFQDYLKSVRLHQGYRLIVETDQKIIDIAMKCGFSNPQTFSTHFKNEFKVSPTDLRKMNIDALFQLDNKYISKEHKFTEVDLSKVFEIIYPKYGK